MESRYSPYSKELNQIIDTPEFKRGEMKGNIKAIEQFMDYPSGVIRTTLASPFSDKIGYKDVLNAVMPNPEQGALTGREVLQKTTGIDSPTLGFLAELATDPNIMKSGFKVSAKGISKLKDLTYAAASGLSEISETSLRQYAKNPKLIRQMGEGGSLEYLQDTIKKITPAVDKSIESSLNTYLKSIDDAGVLIDIAPLKEGFLERIKQVMQAGTTGARKQSKEFSRFIAEEFPKNTKLTARQAFELKKRLAKIAKEAPFSDEIYKASGYIDEALSMASETIPEAKKAFKESKTLERFINSITGEELKDPKKLSNFLKQTMKNAGDTERGILSKIQEVIDKTATKGDKSLPTSIGTKPTDYVDLNDVAEKVLASSELGYKPALISSRTGPLTVATVLGTGGNVIGLPGVVPATTGALMLASSPRVQRTILDVLTSTGLDKLPISSIIDKAGKRGVIQGIRQPKEINLKEMFTDEELKDLFKE